VSIKRGNGKGPLAEHELGFGAYLEGLGYSSSAANKHIHLLRYLSAWLEGEGITLEDLSASKTEAFFLGRRTQGKANLRTTRSLDPLFAFLRQGGHIETPTFVLTDCVDLFIDSFHTYLRAERGLVEGTARFYVHVARLFASERVTGNEIEWATVCAKDVTRFATRVCRTRGLSSARAVVSALRCLLRFLRLEGLTELALDQAVLSVAGSSPSLPRGIAALEVRALLEATDRQSPLGCRDYAILMVLCRLGLRGGELIGLTLDDIDWRAGEIVVVGKGGRRDRLPLPVDVGSALADYLQRSRPDVEDRFVFLRHCAPIRRIGETGTIRSVLARACARAGIAYASPHRLRHTVATEMLRAGVSLRDIGQVLGHRDALATATYAKVDLARLGALARPWPAVAP
jgi:site-specific recombinase XerD